MMNNNASRKFFSNITEAFCEYTLHEIYKYIPSNARSYVLTVIGLQGGLTVIINSLVLVSIRQTNQSRKLHLKTTKMLSTLDIIATSFAAIMFSFFTSNYVQDCNIATLLQSINIYLSQLNTSLMCFISLDRYLHVKCSSNYQTQIKNKVTIVSFILGISWPIFQFVSSNIRSSATVLFVTGSVSLLTNISVIILLISFNLATFLVLRKYRKQQASLPSSINKRGLRLSQLYIISFAIFKIQIIPFLLVWYTIDVSTETRTIVAFTAFNVDKLDAIVNSVIFFCVNKIARSYLMRKLRKIKIWPL